MRKGDILKTVKREDIRFVRLQFTDINGTLKSFEVSTKELEDVLDNGQSFDGSSITGYSPIEESDMVAKPDPDTFVIIPWTSEGRKSARMICNIYQPNGKRFPGDPRYIAQRAADAAKKRGFVFKVGPELEFFVFQQETEYPTPMDVGGYFDFHPGDLGEDMRRDISATAEKFGLTIEVGHHECAKGQHEIDFRFDDMVVTADRVATLKMIIKAVANEYGFFGTFMPKPVPDENGSGMHVHESLWTLKGENAFYGKNSKKRGNISNKAMHFVGGQLKYGREMCVVLSSWPNSYRRLVPGFEAPVYIAWAFKNRSPLIRVPDAGKRKVAARIEIRSPDPAGNPYLQFAVLCHTGLEGMKKKIDPGVPTEKNLYAISKKEMDDLGIESLPETFGEALNAFEKSKIMEKALGKIAFNNFLNVKRAEWDLYKGQISGWEIDRYLRWL
jgi:glutamine synthetase